MDTSNAIDVGVLAGAGGGVACSGLALVRIVAGNGVGAAPSSEVAQEGVAQIGSVGAHCKQNSVSQKQRS